MSLNGAVNRVVDGWENLCGWMPNGRGVTNWTIEVNRAIAYLQRESVCQVEHEYLGPEWECREPPGHSSPHVWTMRERMEP
jgi:hypothetical protein